jgi:hypothetical protein
MTAEEMASRLARRAGAFKPAVYASLRSEAVRALRAAVEGYISGDERALGRALADGHRIVGDIDALHLPAGVDP